MQKIYYSNIAISILKSMLVFGFWLGGSTATSQSEAILENPC